MERAIKPKQGGTELIKHPDSEKGRVGVEPGELEQVSWRRMTEPDRKGGHTEPQGDRGAPWQEKRPRPCSFPGSTVSRTTTGLGPREKPGPHAASTIP